MKEIGEELKEARLQTSLSIEEASEDTSIPVMAIEQIEEGSIGAFKDMFKLKDYLSTYAKYLGLDVEQLIDRFSEYMFEYTTKIEPASIEKAIEEQEKQEESMPPQGIQAVSPYLKPQARDNKARLLIVIIVIILLVAVTLIWAIKQVM